MKRTLLRLLLTIFSTTGMFTPNGSAQQNTNPKCVVNALAESERYSWIGTNDGVWKINKKNKQREHLTTANSLLPSNKVSSICVEPNGKVWIGTSDGILCYDNYTFYVINSKNTDLPDDNITAIACDVNNNIWIGTRKGGLVEKLQYGRYILYNAHNSKLLNDSICSITTDDNGNVWVGSYSDGVTLIRNSNWAVLNSKSGFDGKNILSVSNNSKGYHLMCSNGDVYCIADRKVVKCEERWKGEDKSLLSMGSF